jgi:hypothetical protein
LLEAAPTDDAVPSTSNPPQSGKKRREREVA